MGKVASDDDFNKISFINLKESYSPSLLNIKNKHHIDQDSQIVDSVQPQLDYFKEDQNTSAIQGKKPLSLHQFESKEVQLPSLSLADRVIFKVFRTVLRFFSNKEIT